MVSTWKIRRRRRKEKKKKERKKEEEKRKTSKFVDAGSYNRNEREGN